MGISADFDYCMPCFSSNCLNYFSLKLVIAQLERNDLEQQELLFKGNRYRT